MLHVLRRKLHTQRCGKGFAAEGGEVGVEVVPLRREHEGLDALRMGTRTQHLCRAASHAVVVAGMFSDGNPDGSGTYLYVLDPWDRGHGSAGKPGAHLGTHDVGSRYTISWRQFMEEMENAVRVEPGWMWVRLMHATGTSGRRASAGASRAPIT